jgi:HEAT repeat protein
MPLQEPSSKSSSPLGLRAWAVTLLEICIGFCAAVACAELALPSALAQAPVSDPDPSIIRRWVEDLGDRQFEVRDQATAKLSNLSNQQLELLKELLASSTDPEIIVRLSRQSGKVRSSRSF